MDREYRTGRRDFISAALVIPFLAACGTGSLVGKPFPDFQLTDIDGKPVRRADYAGYPLVVNFWATWCRPCREEMPDLERTYQRHAAAGLRILGISVDTEPHPVREFRLRIPVGFPLVLDAQQLLAREVGVSSFPTTFLIGRNGAVREVVTGPRPWPEYPGIARLL